MFKRMIMAVLLLTVAVTTASTANADDVKTWTDAHVDELVALYKQFHAHPELSFEEQETAAKLAQAKKH